MGQTRLILLAFAFQLLLLLLVSLPAWRASGSEKLSLRAGGGVLSLLVGMLLLAGQGVLPNFVSRVVGPVLLLVGMRFIYAAVYKLCEVPAAPRWEPWVTVAGGSALVVLWLADHSPDQLVLARARFMTVAIPVCFTIGFWLQQLWRNVPRPWPLGTRYLSWSASIALLMNVVRIVGVLALHGAQDPIHTQIAPLAIFSMLPTSLLFAFGLILLIEGRARSQLVVANEQLAHDAETDVLTGLGNRRRLENAAAQEIARAQRYGWPVSVMALDLDHFKGINDRWGHHAGDAVLREVALRCVRALRGHDVLVRWGGEEFAALLPQCDLDASERAARRILEAVRSISLDDIGRERLTISIGLAAVAQSDLSVGEALHRADQALYEAKRAGRNRHAVAGVRAEVTPVARPFRTQSVA